MVLEDIGSVKFFVAIVLISANLLPSVSGARILLIVANVNSHVLYFSRLATDLAELGHVTRLVVPSNARIPDFIREVGRDESVKFSYSTYRVDGDEPFVNSRWMSEILMRLALSRSAWEKFTLMNELGTDLLDHWEADCVKLLDNEDAMAQIRDGGFQFAIMDPIVPHCYYAIPYAIGIPYGTMSISSFAWVYRVPRLPSFASSFGYTDRMTFSQRLTTFLVEMIQLEMLNKTTIHVDRLAPNRPSLDAVQLLQQASLWFFLEHIAVGFAHPQMPNTIAIGDLMAGRPGKLLPRDLEEFMSASKDGVIVVSLGSFFDFVPPDVLSKFCDAFRDQRNRLRVVWKVKDASVCSGDGRIKLLPWIPQNDLLADPRVQMFISHGGFNSIIESAYHAKPLIVFPISLDQPTNAGAAELKGFAIRMDIGDFSSETLLSNIDKLLTDPSFKRYANVASAILRDRRETPAQGVSAMIDHVIKYGDRHLRTGAFELSTLQFMMFDIFASIVAALAIVLSSAALVCCCVYRACCRLCGRRNKAKAE